MKTSITNYARLCGISRAAVHRRAKRGLIEIEPAHTLSDGRVYYQVDVDKYPPEGKKLPGRKRK